MPLQPVRPAGRSRRVFILIACVLVIAGATNGPPVLLSASAIGWYGSRGDEELDETSARGSGFLSDLCATWEAATAPAEEAGTRVVHLRTGIVLSANGARRNADPGLPSGSGPSIRDDVICEDVTSRAAKMT